MLATEAPSATTNPFLPALEERLSNLTRAGFDATDLVRLAAAADPTRRPPRRSTLVAHPRPTTANAEPGPRKPRGSHSDETYDHDLTRAAGTEAALGAASGVRPEPLKPRQIATRRSVSVGCVAEPPANHSQSPARPLGFERSRSLQRKK